jgi:hypothetical protein
VIIIHSYDKHKWVTNEITDNSVTIEQPTYRQTVLTAYIKYEKGGEDKLLVSASINEETIGEGEEFFMSAYLSGNRIVPRKMMMTDSGSARIPFALSLNEEKIRITIELETVGPVTPGTVEVWLKPASMQM